jgi:nitrate reductase delta subunit
MNMFGKKSPPASAALTLRKRAALLPYHDPELRGFIPGIGEALDQEQSLSATRLAELDAMLDTLARRDVLANEAEYVSLFDRGRATSLHLFEHVHGDSRDRGPAMIDLAQTYEKAGLYLAEGKLPDYLPAVLEFVSTQPPAEARAFLSEMAHIFNAIFSALQKHRSPYASVLGAMLDLAGKRQRRSSCRWKTTSMRSGTADGQRSPCPRSIRGNPVPALAAGNPGTQPKPHGRAGRVAADGERQADRRLYLRLLPRR